MTDFTTDVERAVQRQDGRDWNRQSTYEILVNTNQRPVMREEAARKLDQLYSAMKIVFGKRENILRFLLVKDDLRQPWALLACWVGRSPIKGTSTLVAPEIGKDARSRRVHAHVKFTVTHNVYTRIDRNGLKAVIDDELREYDMTCSYMKIQVNRTEGSEFYMSKDNGLDELT